MKSLVTLFGLLILTLPVAAAEKDTRLYELRVYRALDGKLDALHARLRDHSIKLLEKHGIATLGVWVPVENPDRRIIQLCAHKDMESATAGWKAFANDADFLKLLAENKVAIVEDLNRFFLNATDFSPKLEAKDGKKERVFELRTYLATPMNLDGLQSRFRDHTVKLFEKHGMTNIAYWTLTDDEKTGCDMLLKAFSPKGQADAAFSAGEAAKPLALVYMLSHASTDAAKKSFDAFRTDPDWTKARTESEAKGKGSLTVKNGVKSLLLKATDYSPLK